LNAVHLFHHSFIDVIFFFFQFVKEAALGGLLDNPGMLVEEIISKKSETDVCCSSLPPLWLRFSC